MRQKMKTIVLTLAMMFTAATPALVPAVVSADIAGNICKGTNIAIGGSSNGAAPNCDQTSSSVNNLYNLAAWAVNVFSVIVGIIAVAMIIYAGFKYITSGGESSNVSGAKNALIYAIIGLVIVALAQFIVHWVLANANNGLSGNVSAA